MQFMLGLIFMPNINAQVANDTLLVKGLATTSEIKLRWMPSDYNIWQQGINHNYKLERTAILYQETSLGFADMNSSRVVLSENIVPLTKNEFESNFPSTDSVAYLAKELMYSTELEPNISENENLADAVAYNDNVESKFLFSMVMAEQSFEVAKAQGLGFSDDDVEIGYTYLYKLSIEMENDTFSRQIAIKYTGELEMPTPDKLEGIGSDLSAGLSWDLINTNQSYNFFNIERSADNVSFEVVNDVPFAFMSELDDDPERAYYNAVLPENGVSYYFRVVGLSPFGEVSAPSESVEVIGVPKALGLIVSIDSLHEANEGALTIDWSSVTDSLNDQLTHFDIYSKSDIDADEVKVNNTPIAANIRQYEVVDAPSDAYYRLEAMDVNGHIYSSLSFGGHIKDSTPPDAPINFNGEILKDGTVILNWAANTEPDLKGYKVFYSNAANGDFVQTQPMVFADTTHVSSIDVNIETDSIYYKVVAYDHRMNRSLYSELLRLERPDNVAPGSPNIAQILARPEGIRISMKLSNSNDVETYKLQRKFREATVWNDILVFTPKDIPADLPLVPQEAMASQFIDTDELDLRIYEYRLWVSDRFDNASVSSIKQIQPFDDLIRGNIHHYRVNASGVQPGLGFESGGSLSGGPTFTSGGTLMTEVKKYRVDLTWHYASEYMSTLREFKVYMQELPIEVDPYSIQANRYPFILINTLSAREAESTALENGNSGYQEKYQLDKMPKSKYVFKVMAYHNDGGFSEYSKLGVVGN